MTNLSEVRSIDSLLDDVRIVELNEFLARSHDAPQQFVAWTELHGLLVILDLKDGAVTRGRYGKATREEAEAVIAELSAAVH